MWHVPRAFLALLAIAAVTAPAAVAAPPPGFNRHFVTFQAPPSALGTLGEISCLPGTVPWGGGSVFSGGIPGTGNSINSSAPTGIGWRARYNNATSRTVDFRVSVICAKRPRGYTVRATTVEHPAVTQATAVASCPTGTVLLSGGTFSSSGSASTFLLSAFPVNTRKFKAVMWNGSDSPALFTVFAVCGRKPAGYELVPSNGSVSSGPATIVGGAQCTAGKQVLGGGIRIGNPIPDVALGGSLDEPAGQWLSEVVANTSSAVSITIYAICAG